MSGTEGGCGHGECTTVDTVCRYSKTSRMSEHARQGQWSAADLDRCEHGRHSIDSCFDCPTGHSTGNLYLRDVAATEVRRTEENHIEVRIGTTYAAQPIWVAVKR